MTTAIDKLTKANAIKAVVSRCVAGAWHLDAAVKEATAWLQRTEQSPENRAAIRQVLVDAYADAGIDYRGRPV